MSLPIFFGILMGGAGAVQIAMATARRLRRLRRAAEVRRRQADDVARQVRDKAKLSLELKREHRRMTGELEQLRADIAANEATASAQEADEALLYVYDERKMPKDQGYLVEIRHPAYQNMVRGAPEEVTESWRRGRRYLVWASSPKVAMAKTVQRFSPDQGYVVTGGELHPAPPGEV